MGKAGRAIQTPSQSFFTLSEHQSSLREIVDSCKIESCCQTLLFHQRTQHRTENDNSQPRSTQDAPGSPRRHLCPEGICRHDDVCSCEDLCKEGQGPQCSEAKAPRGNRRAKGGLRRDEGCLPHRERYL